MTLFNDLLESERNLNVACTDRTLADVNLNKKPAPIIETTKCYKEAELLFTEDELVELEFLKDQEIDALVEEGLLDESERMNEECRNTIFFEYPEVTLTVTTGRTYPVTPAKYCFNNNIMPRLTIDGLRISLREILAEDAKTNTFENWQARSENNVYGIFEYKMSVVNIVKTTLQHLGRYRESVCLSKTPKRPVSYTGHDLNVVNDRGRRRSADALLEPKKLDADRHRAGARTILGMSVEEMCADIPSEYRILHVEPVMRSDLRESFLETQAGIADSLWSLPFSELKACVPENKRRALKDKDEERKLLIDYLVKPQMTFHGTSTYLVGSIVRNGFLLPGDIVDPESEKGLTVRCGSTYGRGIYSSPDPSFALSYSGYAGIATKKNEYSGLKLIICATLMGRSAEVFFSDNWRDQSKPYPGADSHVANQQYEYIVFRRSQIIPCYVVHLDWAQEDANKFANIPTNPNMWIRAQGNKTNHNLRAAIMSPGDIQRAKDAIAARAKKFLPYGYGPATGSKFMVEEVGEVDEDEEDYGMYQGDRTKIFENEEGEGDFWSWDTDQYRKDRFGTRIDPDAYKARAK